MQLQDMGFTAMSGWTDDRVEVLKKLWVEGLSAAQIANRLGGVTRNAVIGKVHRLGRAGRKAPSQPATRVRARVDATPRVVAGTEAPPTTAPATAKPSATTVGKAAFKVEPMKSRTPRAPRQGLVDVHGLGTHMCKWPIGDPTDQDFGFCGARCEPGAVYCTEHAAVAYTAPLSARRDREADRVAAQLRQAQRRA